MIVSFQITRVVSLRLQTTFPRSPFLLAERIFLKPEVFFIYLSLGWEDKHVTSDFSTRLPLVPPSEFLRKLCRPDLRLSSTAPSGPPPSTAPCCGG